MKILVIADVHANWLALSAIRESFDACLFLGDLVEYGVDPIPCIDWVRKHATFAIRGNHDHSVAQRVPPPVGTGFRQLAGATRQIHWNILRPSHLKYLSQLANHCPNPSQYQTYSQIDLSQNGHNACNTCHH